MATASNTALPGADDDSLLPQLSPTEMIRCLERQPTFYGPDSVFHCISGLPSGDEMTSIRKEIANFVETSFGDKLFMNFNLSKILPSKLHPKCYAQQQNSKLVHKSAVFQFDKQFSLRIKKGDKDFPKASELKDEFFEYEDNRLQSSAAQSHEDFNWPSRKKDLSNTNYQCLLSEYAKYIRAPWSVLGLAELELLAIKNQWKIHVYTNQEDGKYDDEGEHLPRIKYQCTLNDIGPLANKGDKYLLYEDDGAWQPLKVKSKMRRFLRQRIVQIAKWKDNQTEVAAVEMDFRNWADSLRENYKTFIAILFADGAEHTELLQRCLLFRFVANEEAPTEVDMNSLAQFVAHCKVHNMDPTFYLHIVREFRQEHWKHEFLLLEIEELLLSVLEEEERDNWRVILHKLSDDMVTILRKRLKATGDSAALDKEKLDKILKLLELLGIDLTEDVVKNLGVLPLDNWYSELRMAFWRSKINHKLNTVQLTDEEKNEAVFVLLQLDNKEGESYCEEKFNDLVAQPMKHLDSTEEDRSEQDSVNVIIDKMKTNQHSQLKEVIKNAMSIQGNPSGCFKKNNSDVIKSKWLKKSLDLTDDFSIMEFLNVYDKIIKSKMGFPLRNTQKVAIVTLLKWEAKTLAQVSTGEGKSLIVAGVAIGRVRAGQTVDVITSNDVLAKRDSESKLADIYAAFKIKVGNNCSKKAEKRAEGYKCPVVYGQMANFQRDYLLDAFYGYKIRSDRQFVSVIVDEVDCMLLDRGNNVLYLSHDIPGMEMLESLYVFIKERMEPIDHIKSKIKSAVLYDLYGVITKSDLELALSTEKEKIDKLWSHLTQRKVVDQRGRLLFDDAKFITEDRIKYDDSSLNGKLVFYLRQVAGRERRIRIPFHLLSFVDRHLDTWLDSAFKALKEKRGEGYEVHPKSEPKSVIIIDPDTGTDQTSSQWAEALHQFLQLKEGCLLTLQSLKSVFISNVTYIKRYTNLAGLTGTLGSKPERDFLQTTYECNYVTVPTAFPRKFTMKQARVVKTTNEWLTAIVEETRQSITTDRSLVIFCESIKKVNKVVERLKTDLKSELDNKKLIIHSYTRDYEEFAFECSELDVGQVIVATNLAGRGTDIKISPKLQQNGGLHICLTYLPENLRIEEQALGRAGRKRDSGSGILIVRDPSQQSRTVNEMKFKRNRKESHRISRLAQDFSDSIKKQEECFRHFFQHFRYLKRKLEQPSKKKLKLLDEQEVNCVCNSALDQWALWLDSIVSFESQSLEQLLGRLKTFLHSIQLPTDTKDIDWMTPGRLMVMAKHLATRKLTNKEKGLAKKEKETNLTKADDIFKKLVKSKDSFFYPAAHYYRAFIVLKEGGFQKKKDPLKNIQKKKRFISMLQTTEILLKEHISMHKSFSAVSKGIFYKRQKENMMGILENYLQSVQSLLGRRCSVSGFIEAGFDATKVEKLMEKLANDRIVTCQVNKEIPGGRDTIRQVAYNHAVSEESLRKFLQNDKEYKFNELIMKGKLAEVKLLNRTSTVMDRCWTRDRFWDFLLKSEALHSPVDNVVIPETQCKFHPKSKQIQMDPRGFENYFFYNTKYRSKKDLEDNSKKIMFTRDYLKEYYNNNRFPTGEFERQELAFEFCKFAQLKPDKLRDISALKFGNLEQGDLALVNIYNQEDRQDIWKEMTKQNVTEYNNQKPFNYSKCVYEDPVRKLIEKTFAAEKVRSRWLDVSDAGSVYAIEDLPLRSDRDLLWDDLLATHIISGARVTDQSDVDLKSAVKEILKEITSENAGNERKKKQPLIDSLSSYLESCRALYAAMETPDAWLHPLKDDEEVDESVRHQNHHLMSLVGFDHVMVLEEKKWSRKMLYRALAIIFIGAAQLAVAVTLLYIGISPQIAVGLIGAGVGDVLFAMNALLTDQHFSWSDYGRHKQKQIVKLLVKIGVGIAEDGFIVDGDVPLEDIINTVAKQLKDVQLAKRNHLNEIDIDTRRVLRILQQERKREEKNINSKTTDHILKLMKKTKDPKLFAVLVRDKIPIDQFCADALSCVLTAHLGSNVVIQVENTGQVFDRPETADPASLVVKIERGIDSVDLFECVAQHFPEQGVMDRRQSLASRIETDSIVSGDIRKVWQSRNLKISLFGSHVTSKKGVEKTDFAVSGIVAKDQRRLTRRHPFHDDYALIHSAINDRVKKIIPCNKYPVLSVTYPEDDAAGKAGKKEDFKLFRHVQRGYLERGKYKNAVWNTVENNWMPVAKRISETNVVLGQNHETVEPVKNHFQQYTSEGFIDAQTVKELETILDNRMARLSGIEAQGNTSVEQP